MLDGIRAPPVCEESREKKKYPLYLSMDRDLTKALQCVVLLLVVAVFIVDVPIAWVLSVW